jgi:hypothetical protein
VNDVWKVTPKLTLSLGLRYENSPSWKDISGNLTTVYYNAFDNTPNITDSELSPGLPAAREGYGRSLCGTESALAEHSPWGIAWAPKI